MITVIREAHPYLAAVAALEKECFAEPWSENTLAGFLDFPFNGAFVALCGDVFAGYVTFSLSPDDVQIANVAVSTAFRRRGVASALLKELIRLAEEKERTRLTLEVRTSNVPAIALYKASGFFEAGLRRRFYTHPVEDALLLNYEL